VTWKNSGDHRVWTPAKDWDFGSGSADRLLSRSSANSASSAAAWSPSS